MQKKELIGLYHEMVLIRRLEERAAELYQQGKAEVASRTVGDMVMEGLKALDHIAYIRFASVYREFADITTLKEEVDTLLDSKDKEVPSTAQLPLLPGAGMELVTGRRRRNRK